MFVLTARVSASLVIVVANEISIISGIVCLGSGDAVIVGLEAFSVIIIWCSTLYV